MNKQSSIYIIGVARGARDKNKDLGNYDKYLPLRDCFFAGLLISGLTKKKFNTT